MKDRKFIKSRLNTELLKIRQQIVEMKGLDSSKKEHGDSSKTINKNSNCEIRLSELQLQNEEMSIELAVFRQKEDEYRKTVALMNQANELITELQLLNKELSVQLMVSRQKEEEQKENTVLLNQANVLIADLQRSNQELSTELAECKHNHDELKKTADAYKEKCIQLEQQNNEIVQGFAAYKDKEKSDKDHPLQIEQPVKGLSGSKKTNKRKDREISPVESIDKAIVEIDLDNLITRWNIGARELYGYSSAEVLGFPFSILVPRECYGEFQQVACQTRLEENASVHNTQLVRKDGERINVVVIISPLKDELGRVSGVSTVTSKTSLRALNINK